jgi:hypothetical protein
MTLKLCIYLNSKAHILDVDSKESIIDGICFIASLEDEGALLKVNGKELHLKLNESIVLKDPKDIFVELKDEETLKKETIDFLKGSKLNDPLDDLPEFKTRKEIKDNK